MSKRLRTLHKWFGLSVCLLVLLQAITGLLLAHRDRIERVYYDVPAELARDAASLDLIMTNLAELAPEGFHLERIVYPRTGGVLTARFEDLADRMLIAKIDPSSGSVLSSGAVASYPLDLADRLHVSLMMGRAGQNILLAEGIAIIFMVVSGVWLWWPRSRRFVQALTVEWRLGAHRLANSLHQALGALVAVVLLILAVGGSLLVAEPFVKAVVSLAAPIKPDLSPDLPPATGSAPVVTWQQSLDQLQRRFSDGQLRQVRPLGEQGRLLGVLFIAKDAINPRAHHIGGVDRLTGELLVFDDAHDALAGDRFMEWFLPVHTGEIYGPLRGLLLTVAAITLMVLVCTGLMMWLLQRARVRRAVAASMVNV